MIQNNFKESKGNDRFLITASIINPENQLNVALDFD